MPSNDGGQPSAVDPRLGQWLRALRRSVSPEQVGIPVGSRRRSAWLTQVELARLAGLTPRAYQGVEQGHRRPGPRVLDGLVKALRLAPAQVTHLQLLASESRPPPSMKISTAAVSALITQYAGPAVAYDHAWQVVACNEAFRAVAPDAADGNLLLWYFSSSQPRHLFVDWHAEAAHLVARYRAVQAHYDADTEPFDQVTARLVRANEHARQLWEGGVDVAAEPASRTFRIRSDDGQVRNRCVIQLQPAGQQDPSLRIAYCLPDDGEPPLRS